MKTNDGFHAMRKANMILLLSCALSTCLSMALFRHVLHGRIAWHGSLSLLLRETLALFTEPLFLLALVAFVVANLLWLTVLATQELSVAYPVQIGLVTLFAALVSVLLFKEAIPLRGYIGYAMLLAGVLLIYR